MSPQAADVPTGRLLFQVTRSLRSAEKDPGRIAPELGPPFLEKCATLWSAPLRLDNLAIQFPPSGAFCKEVP